MKNIAIQNYSLLEFSIVGLENGGKFPIEYTGRGKDISPEIIGAFGILRLIIELKKVFQREKLCRR